MILGLSVHTFTVIHVLISLVGIVAGVIIAFSMVQGKSVPGWTALALLALILTSVTGFFFHNTTFTPAQGVGVISLVVLAVAVIALYFLHLTGLWRWVYVITAMVAIYLNVFVGVIQAFEKIGFLEALAPHQTEPPFIVAQLVVLAIFVVLGFGALRKFHPRSESFPSHDLARKAAERAAREQHVPGETRAISWEDAGGKWHEELSAGTDRPETDVEG